MKNKKEIKRRRNRNLRHKSTFYCNNYVYSPVRVSGPHAKISIVIPPAIEASASFKDSLDASSWEYLRTVAADERKELKHACPAQSPEHQSQAMPHTKRRVLIGIAAAVAVACGIGIGVKHYHAYVR